MLTLNAIWLTFFTLIGASIGSFLNVVIYRLPAEKSLASPGSHCPNCGHNLAWWENIPILAWFYLRAKCTSCKIKISSQYVIIESITAAFFAGFYILYYLGLPMAHSTYSQMLHYQGFEATWPVYLSHVILIAALIAATLIDFRYFIIPVEIPWFVSIVGLLLPIAAWFMPHLANRAPSLQVYWITDPPIMLPWVDDAFVGPAIGAVIGVGIAKLLVELGYLPRSFDIYLDVVSENTQNQPAASPPPVESTTEQPAPPLISEIPPAPPASDDSPTPAPATQIHIHQTSGDQPTSLIEPDPYSDQPWPTHPHPRREVLKEALFLLFPTVGFFLGSYLWQLLLGSKYGLHVGHYAVVLRTLGGVCMGYIVGGGMIWITRILGTLGFGKEALGLGDVYLLAAIGAILGPQTTVDVYFLAPFLGLTYALIAFCKSRFTRGVMRVLPYGPALALATVLILLFVRGPNGLFF